MIYYYHYIGICCGIVIGLCFLYDNLSSAPDQSSLIYLLSLDRHFIYLTYNIVWHLLFNEICHSSNRILAIDCLFILQMTTTFPNNLWRTNTCSRDLCINGTNQLFIQLYVIVNVVSYRVLHITIHCCPFWKPKHTQYTIWI